MMRCPVTHFSMIQSFKSGERLRYPTTYPNSVVIL